MATEIFNIQSIFRQVFHSIPVIFPSAATTQQAAQNNINFPTAPVRKTIGAYGSSLWDVDSLGREYYCPATLDGFPLDYPVVRISGSQTVVSTPMTERKGSVHEIISGDDYMISIKGLIINHDTDELPEDIYNTYYDLLEKGKSMVLRCALTDRPLHPDYKVIIKSFAPVFTPGVQNVIGYELELISDFVFTLTVS